MIVIIDYGMGNIHSVSKALERLGQQYMVTNARQKLAEAAGLILPGVGAFGDAMQELREQKLDTAIKQLVAGGKPLLGICLGMQLLFSSSVEGGHHAGLNLLSGHVRRFQGVNSQGEKYKVPHMGWNDLHMSTQNHPIGQGVSGGYAYFVHSYYVADMKDDDLLAYTEYDGRVPAIVGQNQVIGMQFHPEKSSVTGMKLLANFTQMCT